MKFSHHLQTLLLATIAVGFFYSPISISAQEKPEEISLKFRVYLWNEPATPPVPNRPVQVQDEDEMPRYIPQTVGLLNGKQELKEFEIPLRQFSEQLNYRGTNPMMFAVQRLTMATDKPSYRELGRVNVPEGVKEAILFFFPRPDAVETYYNISLLPSSIEDIPIGYAQVVNMTGGPIAAMIGNQQIALNAGGFQKLQITGIENHRFPVSLGVQAGDGQWRLDMQRNVTIHDGSSVLIIFHRTSGNYQMETIRLKR